VKKNILRSLIAVTLASTPVAAQQWSVEAQAGQMRNALDPASTAQQNLVVGARYDHFESALRISAGVPTSSSQILWGSLAGSHRFAFRTSGFLAGVDISGNAFVLQERERTREISDVFNQRRVVAEPAQSGFAAAFQGMPVVGYEATRWQATVRGGVSRYTSEFAEQRRDRQVTLAEAQLSFTPTPSFALMPVLRHFITDDGDLTYGGVTAVAGSSNASIWASAGRWTNLVEQDPTWAAGATLRLHDRVSLNASGRSDAVDPLYGTPAQTSWSAGVAIKLGRIVSASAAAPAVMAAGNAIVRLPASKARAGAPQIAGDFNNWKPQPMRRDGDAWVYHVSVAAGVYNYAFVGSDGRWFVPEDHPGRKRDGMGGDVAVLVVR
jgi:hypothetical protein